MELYGLKKVATENLRDMLKGLKKCSEDHARLSIFRMLCGLVPGDDEGGLSIAEAAAAFYRRALRHLVEVLGEDHLSGLKGAAFWTHFSRPDCIKLPLIYLEKVIDRLTRDAKAEAKKAESASQSRRQKAAHARRERDISRGIKCCEAALADHAQGKLADIPDASVDPASRAKVYEYGDVDHGSKPRTRAQPGVKMAPRLCVDCFLYRALQHWLQFEEDTHEELKTSYGSWDENGDGKLQLDEFGSMIKHSNPATEQRTITRAFIAASKVEADSGEEFVDIERLAPALQIYNLVLTKRPAGWIAPASEAIVDGTDSASSSSAAASGAGEARRGMVSLTNSMQQLRSMQQALGRMSNARGEGASGISEADVMAEAKS